MLAASGRREVEGPVRGHVLVRENGRYREPMGDDRRAVSLPGRFLTGRWTDLAMLNFACPPELLEPFVPRGAELDAHGDLTQVSMVGFMFRDTRVLGVPVPFHRTFEEVNLRFYVRRTVDEEVRRG